MITALVSLGVLVSAVPQQSTKIGLTTFDGARGTTQTWRSENDPVMGGVSTGSFKVDSARKIGVWSGEVKVVPKLQAPGFCTARTQHSFPDISSADGLLVTARATGDLKKVKVTMDSSVRASPRQGEFEGSFTLTDTMATHFIPFASMTQSWRGQKEGGPPSKQQLAKITGLGFIEDGIAGKFDFEILSIAAGPGPSPQKRLPLAGFSN